MKKTMKTWNAYAPLILFTHSTLERHEQLEIVLDSGLNFFSFKFNK